MVCPLSHVPHRQVPGESRTWMQSCPFYIFPHSKSLNTIFKKRTRGAVSPRSQGVSASSWDAPSVHSRGRVPLGNWHGYRFVHRGTGCALRFPPTLCRYFTHSSKVFQSPQMFGCSSLLFDRFKKKKQKQNPLLPTVVVRIVPSARSGRSAGRQPPPRPRHPCTARSSRPSLYSQ